MQSVVYMRSTLDPRAYLFSSIDWFTTRSFTSRKPDAAIECVFVCRSVACWLSGSCVDGLVLNRRSSEHKSQLKLESIRALANCITFAVGAAGHFHFHFHLPTSPFPCERPHVVIHMLQIALRHSAAYEIDEWTTSRLISVIVAN